MIKLHNCDVRLFENVQEFMSLTSAPTATALLCLRMAAGDLQKAKSIFDESAPVGRSGAGLVSISKHLQEFLASTPAPTATAIFCLRATAGDLQKAKDFFRRGGAEAPLPADFCDLHIRDWHLYQRLPDFLTSTSAPTATALFCLRVADGDLEKAEQIYHQMDSYDSDVRLFSNLPEFLTSTSAPIATAMFCLRAAAGDSHRAKDFFRRGGTAALSADFGQLHLRDWHLYQRLSDFMASTSAPTATALFCLRVADGDLEKAEGFYLGDEKAVKQFFSLTDNTTLMSEARTSSRKRSHSDSYSDDDEDRSPPPKPQPKQVVQVTAVANAKGR